LRNLNTSPKSRQRPLRTLFSFMARPSLAIWMAASLAGTAFAIDPHRAMSQYVRDRWGPEQGFPRGPVYAISQSDDGYLWIGTQDGLVRFDGLTFRLMRDVKGLAHGESVLGLMTDRNGSLWVRLDGATLLRYRNGVFDHPVPDALLTSNITSNITAMTQTTGGELLIAVMERGAMVHHGGSFKLVANAGALPRSPVLSIAQTSDGSIWEGTRGAGLFRFRGGQSSSIVGNLPDLKVNCLVSDPKGDLWIGTDEGIAHWDGRQLVARGVQSSLGRTQVLAMSRDRDGWERTPAA
jgi:ligand-binding sensor domain-containing protein